MKDTPETLKNLKHRNRWESRAAEIVIEIPLDSDLMFQAGLTAVT